MDKGMRHISATMIGFGLLLCAAGALSQSAPKVFVSPNKGQSQDQQNKDTSERQQWASQQAPPSQRLQQRRTAWIGGSTFEQES